MIRYKESNPDAFFYKKDSGWEIEWFNQTHTIKQEISEIQFEKFNDLDGFLKDFLLVALRFCQWMFVPEYPLVFYYPKEYIYETCQRSFYFSDNKAKKLSYVEWPCFKWDKKSPKNPELYIFIMGKAHVVFKNII